MLSLFRRRVAAHEFITTVLQIGFTSIVTKATSTVNLKRSKCAYVTKWSRRGLDGFLHFKKLPAKLEPRYFAGHDGASSRRYRGSSHEALPMRTPRRNSGYRPRWIPPTGIFSQPGSRQQWIGGTVRSVAGGGWGGRMVFSETRSRRRMRVATRTRAANMAIPWLMAIPVTFPYLSRSNAA
jgi:hypothetical protein